MSQNTDEYSVNMDTQSTSQCSDWSSQIIDDHTKEKLINITDGNDIIYISVAPYYSLSRNSLFFNDAREAILHRYLYEEFAIVTPSPYIVAELQHGMVHVDEDCMCIGCIIHTSKEGTTGGSSPNLSSCNSNVSQKNRLDESVSFSSVEVFSKENTSGDDSDATVFNGSLDLFSPSDDTSEDPCNAELGRNEQSASTTTKQNTCLADVDTDCSSKSESILRPRRRKQVRHVFLDRSEAKKENRPVFSHFGYKSGLTESQAIIITDSDSDSSSLSESILHPKRKK